MTLFLFALLAQLSLSRSDQSGCEVRFSQKPELIKGGAGSTVTFSGGSSSRKPGEPDLQFKEFWVGIPQTGAVTLSVSAGDYERFADIEVAPVPWRSFESSDRYENDPSIYEKNEFYPPALATVVEIGELRGLRVAKIRVTPAQYNPKEKLLRVYSNVAVRLQFSRPPTIVRSTDDSFGRIYSQTVLNYPVCKDWRIAQAPALPDPFAISTTWLKIQTRDEGVYKITPAALARLGYEPATIDPRTFRLFTIGAYTPNEYYPESTLTEIPVYAYGEDDGRFDNDDYLLFYARSTSFWDFADSTFFLNPYTDYNYFWFTWGAGSGARMVQKNGPTGLSNPLPTNRVRVTVHFERDSVNTAWGGLLWNWLGLDGQLVPRGDINLTVPNGDSLIKLTGFFYPRTTVNKLNLYLNQELITTITFSHTVHDPYGAVPETVSIPVDRRLTKEENTVTFEIVGKDTATTFFDYFDADYLERLSLQKHSLKIFLDTQSRGYRISAGDARNSSLVFDIQNPFQPELIVGSSVTGDSLRFLTIGGLYYITDLTKILEPSKIERRTPGRLRNAAAADYYIVTPDEFYDAALFLERYRQGNVGTVKTVKISEIYDDYGFGMAEPGAIKEFFKDKKPRYGLFTADGSYDYKNNLNRDVPPLIPPYELGYGLEPSVYDARVAGFDSWYADFTGTGSTPDMALSRVTVRSPKELRQFVDKVIAYEQSSYGPWARRFILAADDVKGTSTAEFDHIANCEEIGELANDRFDLVKVYLTEYPYEGSVKPQAKADLIKEMNRGGVGFCFFGHGNGHQLAHEQAFVIGDVPQVQNGKRLPFYFFGSCGVGRFEDTNFECIAEELVRSPAGGIGSFAATKGSFSSENLLAALALYSALFDGETSGDAYVAAMLAASNYTYQLFGDPATRLLVPEPAGTVTISPDRFPLGGPIQIQSAAPIGAAEYSLVGTGLSFTREYSWADGSGIHKLSYDLPGQEFFRGVGEKLSDSITTQCFVPLELPRTTVSVSDGTYTPVMNSGRVGFYLWTPDHAFLLRKDLIGIDTTYTPGTDRIGPAIVLYANGEKFVEKSAGKDTVYDRNLPRSFSLVGEISDTSGIRLLEVAGQEPFGFYINRGWIYLSEQFSYDPGSWTRGRFSYPVTLPSAEDTIVVNVYDNLSNRTVLSVDVQTTALERLAIEKPLVYPNPTRSDAYFTFYLTKDAFVSLKIYTLTGRLITMIHEVPCRAGYNQIHWQGKDEDGSALANGVYFYKLSARTESISSGLHEDESAVLIEKFIVLK